MSDIPVCQQCGKKLYKSYGSRGLLATPDRQYHGKGFRTVEERDNFERDELPENAYDVERYSWGENSHRINYSIPQQSRDGLFHSQSCFYAWHENHRNEIERLIRDMGEWKNPN
tara:strand:+ start:147 stop:488 length:342 start_codon:yes stop_codon:yes gene_type:complete